MTTDALILCSTLSDTVLSRADLISSLYHCYFLFFIVPILLLSPKLSPQGFAVALPASNFGQPHLFHVISLLMTSKNKSQALLSQAGIDIAIQPWVR